MVSQLEVCNKYVILMTCTVYIVHLVLNHSLLGVILIWIFQADCTHLAVSNQLEMHIHSLELVTGFRIPHTQCKGNEIPPSLIAID